MRLCDRDVNTHRITAEGGGGIEREKQGPKSTLGVSTTGDEWGKKEEVRPLNSMGIQQTMIISGTKLTAV